MEYANIINSEIIDNKYDVLWDDVSAIVSGSTRKPVLVLVNGCEPGSADHEQLLKMLSASSLTDDQYNIIHLSPESRVAWHRLRTFLDPRFIIMVGIYPVQLGISASFRLNEPNNFDDRIWLPTPDTSYLQENIEVKKQLWSNGLKFLFIEKKRGEIDFIKDI